MTTDVGEELVWQPVTGRLVGKRLVNVAIALVVLLLAAVPFRIFIDAWWSWIPLLCVIALAAWLCWLVPRQVRAIGYAEREDDLLIRRGIMFRQLLVVPYGRMQYVEVSVGPIDRWFNVSTLQLHTASSHTSADIPGLNPEEAARLRDQLSAKGEARMVGL